MPKGVGYSPEHKRTQTGSKNIKTYDPKTSEAGGKGGKPNIVGKYHPAGKDKSTKPSGR